MVPNIMIPIISNMIKGQGRKKRWAGEATKVTVWVIDVLSLQLKPNK